MHPPTGIQGFFVGDVGVANVGFLQKVYGHFGPKTLRTQDISALKCMRHFGLRIKRSFECRHGV